MTAAFCRQEMPTLNRLAVAAITIGLLSGCGSTAASSPSSSAFVSPTAASIRPAASDCPGFDVTLSELIAIGRPEARECFGTSQLTLRGWVWDDRGAYDCVSYSAPGDPMPPGWLYCAATDHARLTPVPYPPGEPSPGVIRPQDGPFLVAVDPGTPAAGVLRPNRWVEVVGRFDDPVTELCELVGDPNFREQCLSTFVVSDAQVIDGP